MLALPECTAEQLTDVMQRIEAAVVEHDKMAATPMSDDMKKAICEKVCPSDWLTAMQLAANDISNYFDKTS